MAELGNLDWVRGEYEPLAGTATIDFHDWEELALNDAELFRDDLIGSGFADDDIEEALGVQRAGLRKTDEAIEEFWNTQPRRHAKPPPELAKQLTRISARENKKAKNWLSDWWANRQLVVVEREMRDLKLPLFVLSSAPVKGSCSHFTVTKARGRKASWSMTLVGTGLSGSAEITATASAGFQVSDGKAKLVFLPVTVAVEQVRPNSGGPLTTRLDLSPLRGQNPTPGTLLLDALPARGTEIDTFSLAGDTTGDISTYDYVYKLAKGWSASLGLTFHGVNLSAQYDATTETDFDLSFDLPGKHDYRLYDLTTGDGVLWRK